jgi:hypothetical protein
MKKLILTSLFGMVTAGAFAISTSLTILPGTYTNLLSVYNGSAQVSQIIITATTSGSNTSVLFIDAPTNSLIYTNSAYTNNFSYLTNLVYAQTDFYGNTYTLTNYQMIDVTNNLVAASTNSYPVRIGVGTAAGTSASYNTVNYYFNYGVWVTNTSSGNALVTITYRQ